MAQITVASRLATRYLLPTSIPREEPNFVLDTNLNVLFLQYLLRPKNEHYEHTGILQETMASMNLQHLSCRVGCMRMCQLRTRRPFGEVLRAESGRSSHPYPYSKWTVSWSCPGGTVNIFRWAMQPQPQ